MASGRPSNRAYLAAPAPPWKYEHYQLLGHYYLGRIFADQGKKERAKKEFEAVLQKADPQKERSLIAACNTAISKTQRLIKYRLNPQSLSIFMPEADMLKY